MSNATRTERLQHLRDMLRNAVRIADEAKRDRTVTPAWVRELESLRERLGQPALFREMNQ